MWDYEAFVGEAAQLVRRSQAAVADGEGAVAVWQWRHGTRPHLPGNSFLVSKDNARVVRRRTTMASWASQAVEKESCDGKRRGDAVADINALLDEQLHDNIEDDPSALPPVATTDALDETVLFEFHIVFHAVYLTPVLYFRVFQLDGTPVAFHNDLLHGLCLPGGNARTALVAMEDHQVLGTPFYLLHPCETASAMALLLPPEPTTRPPGHQPTTPSIRSDPTYLLAWLSLVQPLTRINPLMYYTRG